MSFESSIFLISDDAVKAKELKDKLVLLRDVDSILVAKYSESLTCFDKNVPDCIIMFSHNNEKETLELVKRVRLDLILKNTPIIMVAEKFNQEFTISAFDEGITDFILQAVCEAELLMHVIWALQRNDMLREIESRRGLLSDLNVLEADTGIYTSEYTEKVFAGEIKEILKYKSNACLMIIAPDVNSKNKLSPTLLASIIKKSIRTSDIIGKGQDDKIYVILPKTRFSGVLTVYEKIKKNLTTGASVCIGACEINKKSSYDKIIEKTNKALYEALARENTIVFVEDTASKKEGGWLDKVNSSKKDFKLFKQAYIRKLDNVITPVFYDMQKLVETKIPAAKLEQRSTEALSVFVLRKDVFQSTLKITYTGFAKVNIDIINIFGQHQEEDRIVLELTELTDFKLTEMMEKIIQEFRLKIDG